MNKKNIGMAIAILLLTGVFFETATASSGVAIAPAKENMKVNINGENKTFTVFNTGTDEMKYKIDIGGNAAKFAEPKPRYITIPGEEYRKIQVFIEPTTEYNENTDYTLIVHPRFYIEGGIVAEAGAKATLDLQFHGERQEPFPEPELQENKTADVETEVEKMNVTKETTCGTGQCSNETNWFEIIGAAILFGILCYGAYTIWREHEEEKEDDDTDTANTLTPSSSSESRHNT